MRGLFYFLIYFILFYIIWKFIKTIFRNIGSKRNNYIKSDRNGSTRYKNIEDAKFTEIKDEDEKKEKDSA